MTHYQGWISGEPEDAESLEELGIVLGEHDGRAGFQDCVVSEGVMRRLNGEDEEWKFIWDLELVEGSQ
jgi:hypothetical protein